MSVREVSVALQCCGADVDLEFRRSEAPALPTGKFRKNFVCPHCKQFLILTLTQSEEEQLVEQELIRF